MITYRFQVVELDSVLNREISGLVKWPVSHIRWYRFTVEVNFSQSHRSNCRGIIYFTV